MRLRVGIRKFLNKPGFHDQASIIAEVENTTNKKNITNRWESQPHVKLNISDCNRTISLDFDWDSVSARANSVNKIDVMIDTLVKFRKALVEEQEIYTKRQKENKWK